MNTTLRFFDGYTHTSPQLAGLVGILQTKLIQEGYKISPDGKFGSNTLEAVMDYQSKNNLEVDGIVGRHTWASLHGEPAMDDSFLETDISLNNSSYLIHLKMVGKYMDSIRKASETTKVEIPIICAVGSRESSWGLSLTPPGPSGTGDFFKRSNMKSWRTGSLPPDGGGFGRGLMQIDFDSHEFARTGEWRDPEANILYGAKVIAENLKYFKKKDPVDKFTLYRRALAAYNCGSGNVNIAIKGGRDIDYFTSHRDYSKDVLNRAGWFDIVLKERS